MMAASVSTASAATTTSKLMKGIKTKTWLPKNSSNRVKIDIGSQETAQNDPKRLKIGSGSGDLFDAENWSTSSRFQKKIAQSSLNNSMAQTAQTAQTAQKINDGGVIYPALSSQNRSFLNSYILTSELM